MLPPFGTRNITANMYEQHAICGSLNVQVFHEKRERDGGHTLARCMNAA